MLMQSDVDRLGQFADFEWLECDVPFDRSDWTTVPEDPGATAQVAALVGDADGLIVCHGSPRIGPAILAAAPKLRVIGELEAIASRRGSTSRRLRRLGFAWSTRPTARRTGLPSGRWA
jgi:hypothetical protein